MRVNRTPRLASPLGSTHKQIREVCRAIMADLDLPHGEGPELREGLWALLGLGEIPDLVPTPAEEGVADAVASAFTKDDMAEAKAWADSDRVAKAEAEVAAKAASMAASVAIWFAFERAMNDAVGKPLRWGRAAGGLRKGDAWSLVKALGLDPSEIDEIPQPAPKARRAKGVGRGAQAESANTSAEVEALREALAKAQAEAEEAKAQARAAEQAKAEAALANALARAEAAEAALANALTPEVALAVLLDKDVEAATAVQVFNILRSR